MLAYNNDPALKAAICAEIQRHQDADLIMAGKYWTGEKGCAVGCSLRSYWLATGATWNFSFGNHKIYDMFLGNGGEALARLEDTLFENMPRPGHLKFPLRVAMAIRPGADISGVCHRFVAWALTNPALFPGCIDPAVKPAVDAVAALYLRAAVGDMPSVAPWDAAEDATMAATGDAAGAAWAAARAAAGAARAAGAAGAAARAAGATGATGDAAGDTSCLLMADKLIDLLEAA